MDSDPKPKARDGLLTHDHSKRGRRFVSVLNQPEERVTLLEPWEHAVLVLCDGTMTAREILEVLDHPIDGESVDLRALQRCLKFFEAQGLIEEIGLRREGAQPPPSPKTLAHLQHAYREWHKDPVKTGQILSGDYPSIFPDPVGENLLVGLDPTVALPDEDEAEEEEEAKAQAAPVAIGTQLVFGSEEGGDNRAIKSVLAAKDEPETVIGSLTGDDGAGLAEISEDEFEEDELELGENVSALLAAVDNDFAEVEKLEQAQSQSIPPAGKAIAGVAEIPRAKSLAKPSDKVWLSDASAKPATQVWTDASASPNVLEAPAMPIEELTDEDELRDEPTMRSIPYPESALNPTMVGLPADGPEPVIISPPRPSSRAGDRVGAVVGPEPSDAHRNIEASARRRKDSDIAPGRTIEDTLPFDGPTEGSFGAADPSEVDSRNPTSSVDVRPETEQLSAPREEETTSSGSSEHIARGEAREVFELLRRAGLKARSYSDDARDGDAADGPARRSNEKAAVRFEQAIITLTGGDLGLALAHFRALLDQMPESTRLRAFVQAIEAVRSKNGGQASILEDFEGALEDAIAYGRCPKCFSMMAADQVSCYACGFKLRRETVR